MTTRRGFLKGLMGLSAGALGATPAFARLADADPERLAWLLAGRPRHYPGATLPRRAPYPLGASGQDLRFPGFNTLSLVGGGTLSSPSRAVLHEGEAVWPGLGDLAAAIREDTERLAAGDRLVLDLEEDPDVELWRAAYQPQPPDPLLDSMRARLDRVLREPGSTTILLRSTELRYAELARGHGAGATGALRGFPGQTPRQGKGRAWTP